jgi:hypothetical protein
MLLLRVRSGVALQLVEALAVLLAIELAPRVALGEQLTGSVERIAAAVAPPQDQPDRGADQPRPEEQPERPPGMSPAVGVVGEQG